MGISKAENMKLALHRLLGTDAMAWNVAWKLKLKHHTDDQVNNNCSWQEGPHFLLDSSKLLVTYLDTKYIINS